MSWSFSFRGEREAVKKAVGALESPVFGIPEEGDQWNAAKALAVCACEALKGAASNGLEVEANGSMYRTMSAGDVVGQSASVMVKVTPITLTL